MAPLSVGKHSEKCSNCNREITKDDQAYVFQGQVLCKDCDTRLRSDGNKVTTCFFCNTREVQQNTSYEVSMYKEWGIWTELDLLQKATGKKMYNESDDISERYLLCSINVPRCSPCKKRHRILSLAERISVIIPAVLCLILGVYVMRMMVDKSNASNSDFVDTANLFWQIGVFGLFIGILIGAIVRSIIRIASPVVLRDTQPMERVWTFKKIRLLLDSTWEPGDEARTPGRLSPYLISEEFVSDIAVPDHARIKHPHLVGVKGWLLLFVMTLLIITPINAVFGLFYIGNVDFNNFWASDNPIGLIDFTILTVVAFLGIRAGLRLWNRRREAVAEAHEFLHLIWIACLIEYFIMTKFVAVPFGFVSRIIGPRLFYSLVWSTYLLKSKRIRATFPFKDKV